jgi:ribosomal-protein-alanine N-acetyltransferase
VLAPVDSDALPGLAALHRACFDDGWTHATLQTLLADPGTFGVMAGRRPAFGFVLCRLVVDEAEILTIVVADERRGRGWGGRLLHTALCGAAARGARRVLLEVAETNAVARRLYTRAGFMQVGWRQSYYESRHGAPIDALTLARALPLAEP